MSKLLNEMSDEELADARIALDERMVILRAKKKAIQDEVDRRLQLNVAGAHSITNAGGIESQEEVGKNG